MIGLKLGSFGVIQNGSSSDSDPFFANVKILASFEGADESTTFTDLIGGGTLTGSGGAKIDTTYNANGALQLNGGNASRVTSSKQATVGAGQFTLEAYIRPTSAVTGRVISAQDSISPNAVLMMRVNSNGSVVVWLRNSAGTGSTSFASIAGIVDMTGSTEHHFAFTRDGANNVNAWVDGVSVAAGVSTTNPDASIPYFIGAFDNTQERYIGYIRWARITEGACRYTGPFTPPSVPFPVG